MSGIRRGERQGAQSQDLAAQSDHIEARRALNIIDPDAPVLVDLDLLVRDNRIQVRVNGLDPEKVETYAVIMEEHEGWGPFPPLDVFEDPITGDRYIAGGYHRDAAAALASDRLFPKGKPPITQAPAFVHTGGYEAALAFAEEDNLRHGLALSLADKRNIFERRLKRGHAWETASSRSIARDLGVDHKTIESWRSSLTVPNSPVRENEGKKSLQKRVGKDGREYRMDRVQKANQKRTQSTSSTPAPEPPRNLDESEPAGTWQDRPAQPRGMYHQTQGEGWTAKVSADKIELSVEIDPDDPPLTTAEIKPWVIAHMRAAGEGLARLEGYEGLAQEIGDFADGLESDWGLTQP